MRKFSGAFSGFAARVLPRCIQRTKPFAVAQSATESAPVPRRPAHTRPLPANRSAPALSHARDALKARNLFHIQTCDAPAWRGGRKRRAKRETPCRAMRISAAGRSGRGFKTTGPGRGVRPIPPPGRLFQRPSLRGGFARAAFSRAGSPRRCARTPAGEAASGAADARRRPGKAA